MLIGFTASITLNLLLGASLNYLLSKFGLLQIMIVPLAFNVLYPVNVETVSSYFILAATFETLPAEDLNTSIFTFTETEIDNPRLVKMSYESDSFALNSGTGLILLVV